jgi:membrane fusion protein, heavy metal efflux system
VQPQDVMFQIVDTEHLHVELTIFEKDIPKIREKQKVRYKIPNESGRERIATVYLIGRMISESRSVRVHCHMEEEDKNLLPGMYVDATIEITNNSVNALPSEAIVKSENKEFVFVAAEGEQDGVDSEEEVKKKEEKGSQHEGIIHFEMIEVITGVSDVGYTEIKNPEIFKQGSKVVTKGSFFLLSKLKGGGEGH